jgi:hypothetical protein
MRQKTQLHPAKWGQTIKQTRAQVHPVLDKAFFERLEDEKSNLELRSKYLSSEAVTKILTQLTLDMNSPCQFPGGYHLRRLGTGEVLSIVAVHMQQGGTARSCDGNTTVKLFDREISLALIREGFRHAGYPHQERKFARTEAISIYSVCQKLQLEGNLAKKISRQNLDYHYTQEELVWLSDFHADNPRCPSVLRKQIIASMPTDKRRSKPRGKKRKGSRKNKRK